jgi:putative transposon-encoded protein
MSKKTPLHIHIDDIKVTPSIESDRGLSKENPRWRGDSMSKKTPLHIHIDDIKVTPSMVYEAKVVKNGNGATIRSYKKYIGKTVLVIIKDDTQDLMDTLENSAEMTNLHDEGKI